ncbi:hypothetical protein PROFUN_11410 [Planoprotostelium fungivorum]|uniref:Uncharacterized protein n=1 Tax=Planoprotostelium fungivorum TaxID=1890364 RepID=A0A2P6NA70_9EUKA|nr:hypothetical protein PROFUN_11410 [Planoprotostelium fungivorum]
MQSGWKFMHPEQLVTIGSILLLLNYLGKLPGRIKRLSKLAEYRFDYARGNEEDCIIPVDYIPDIEYGSVKLKIARKSKEDSKWLQKKVGGGHIEYCQKESFDASISWKFDMTKTGPKTPPPPLRCPPTPIAWQTEEKLEEKGQRLHNKSSLSWQQDGTNGCHIKRDALLVLPLELQWSISTLLKVRSLLNNSLGKRCSISVEPLAFQQ